MRNKYIIMKVQSKITNITNPSLTRIFGGNMEINFPENYYCCCQETFFKSARDFTARETLNINTIVAHMCEIGSKMDLKQREVVSTEMNSLKTTMKVLIVLLIKASYCMDMETRDNILNFLIKAGLEFKLDEMVGEHTTPRGFGFMYAYFNGTPMVASGLSALSIKADLDEKEAISIPAVLLDSNNLIPKELPEFEEV